MSKTLILYGSLGAAAIAAAAGFFFLNGAFDSDADKANFGQVKEVSHLYLPAPNRKQAHILNHPTADGSYDDVVMRDGTTATVFYDKNKAMRRILVYYQGAPAQEHGPLKYEKRHDDSGHLSVERHLRADGSLEMDGAYQPDQTYLRHTYFAPSAVPSAGVPVVASEQTFDKWWHPTRVVEYRPDRTRSLVHTWGDGLDELFDTYAADGQTLLQHVKTGRGSYYLAVYYPDGQNISVEALNTYQGTTYQWYRPDHTLKYKLTLTTQQTEQVVIADDAGKPLVRQNWSRNYSAPKNADGSAPMRLDYIERFNADAKIDRRYEYNGDGLLTEITDYLGDTAYGARKVWSVGIDGYPTSIKTYDDNYKDDGGRPVSAGERQKMTPDANLTVRPTFDRPKLPDRLRLYGEQYLFRDR